MVPSSSTARRRRFVKAVPAAELGQRMACGDRETARRRRDRGLREWRPKPFVPALVFTPANMTDAAPSVSLATREALAIVIRAGKSRALHGEVPDEPEGSARATGNWRGAETWARVVCHRMRQARILNGFSIEEASERIGYGGNKTQLSLFETQSRFPPIWTVVNAAIQYGVPLDYLFGLVDEDDVEEFGLERAAMTAQIEAMLTRNAAAVALAAAQALEAGLPAVQMARGLVERTQRWMHAYDRFKVRNPEQFDEAPAGAMLETAAVELADAAMNALRMIQRHDTFTKRAAERAASRLANSSVTVQIAAAQALGQAG